MNSRITESQTNQQYLSVDKEGFTGCRYYPLALLEMNTSFKMNCQLYGPVNHLYTKSKREKVSFNFINSTIGSIE